MSKGFFYGIPEICEIIKKIKKVVHKVIQKGVSSKNGFARLLLLFARIV